MPSCVVLGCTSGYQTKKEKTHSFTVPRNPEALELWRKAIRRTDKTIKSGQAVCEKHFRPDEILWKRELRAPDGTVIGVSPYKIPRLVKGSTPSIFAWTESAGSDEAVPMGNVTNPEKYSAELMVCSSDKLSDVVPAISEKNQIAQEENTEASDMSVNCPYILPTMLDVENSRQFVAPITIEELAKSNILLPPGWAKHNIQYDDTIVALFCKFGCIKLGDALKTFPLKEIIVKSDLSLQINVLSQPLGINDLNIDFGPILTINQLQNILHVVDDLHVCTGSQVQQELDEIDCCVVNKDICGTWRHIDCSLLLSEMKVCKFCQRVKKTAARNIRRTNARGQLRRIHLRLSPQKKKKWLKLQEKCIAAQKATKRARNALLTLKSKLDECQEKLNSYSEKSLEELLETANIPQNQKHALNEIVAAAKSKDSKGRRYSEEWILLCMLLHMRSPSGYNFLRVNNILPLPCPRTIRRYLSSINTACGFDQQFFEVLKVALSKKNDIQKHGVLLLDKIATQESVNVDTKSLPYKALVDFGIDEEQSAEFSDKANHGLVIMFQPLFDDYTQPIAVFASRGPVKGHVLAQLIINAIVLLENVGARVHGVVTAGATTDGKFWSELDVSGDRKHLKNYFEHPSFEDRRIFVFSDTPHLIKTIRNRLYNNKILQMDPGKHFIRWKHFEILHEKDKALAEPGRILVCPKLTIHHLVLSNSQKMQVRLAVQVFSNAVASGLRFFQRYDADFNDCEETASFCDWMNKMFDALNRKNLVDGVQPGNPDFKVIQESILKLDEWEENVEKGKLDKELFLTKQTAEGLRVTLQSMLDIVTYLTQHCGFGSVLTGRINQDPVEV